MIGLYPLISIAQKIYSMSGSIVSDIGPKSQVN